MKDKEAFEKMKAYFKGEEARAIIEREIKRLEEQEQQQSGEYEVDLENFALFGVQREESND